MRGGHKWWRWALVSAVLAGALFGRARLRGRAVAGLGRIECALYTPDRFFQKGLTYNLPCHIGDPYVRPRDGARFVFDIRPAAALLLPAEARAGADTRAVSARMIGVDWVPEFSDDDEYDDYYSDLYRNRLGKGCPEWRIDYWGVRVRSNRYSDLWTWSDDEWWEAPEIKRDEVWINEALARALGVGIGDRVMFRVRAPGRAPEEIGGAEIPERAVELGLRVARIVPASKLGDFQLDPRWSAPPNAFMNLPVLQDAVGLEWRANLLVTTRARRWWYHDESGWAYVWYRARNRAIELARRTGSARFEWCADRLPYPPSEYADAETSAAAWHEALEWGTELADYEAELRPAREGAGVELVSVRRRLLERPLVEAVLALAPQAPWGHAATALVDDGGNRGRAGSRAISLMGDTALTPDRTGEVLAIRFAVAAGETPEAFVAALGKQILEGVEPEAMGLRFELVRDRVLKQLVWWLDPLLWIAGAGAVVTAVRRGGKQRERRAY